MHPESGPAAALQEARMHCHCILVPTANVPTATASCAEFLFSMLSIDPAKFLDTAVENNARICQTTNALRSILVQMVVESSRPSDSTRARIVINTLPVQSALNSRFSGGTLQEDAEEFLTYLLNEVSACGDLGATTLQQPGATCSNPATCMRGSSVQSCKCTECNLYSNPVETPFFMLHISLPKANDSERAAIRELVLDDSEFTRAALLDGTNMYHCSYCKAFHVGHRYNLIKTPPEILGVHLKRFLFDELTGSAEKIMTTVDIDNRITLHCSGGEAAKISFSGGEAAKIPLTIPCRTHCFGIVDHCCNDHL